MRDRREMQAHASEYLPFLQKSSEPKRRYRDTIKHHKCFHLLEQAFFEAPGNFDNFRFS